ncbi:MAG: type II toxin-antitoxin system CcdA family antitoxin [Alphaproteobacteria bacterium]|jgi:antitoxin CcdA|nr:type II toxin-antitoxin system CcdA family antitoxin [Alphaproteobacteria bacterium]
MTRRKQNLIRRATPRAQAAERGLGREAVRVKSEKWKTENAVAIDSCNQWVETHGLPLDRYRQF